MFNISGGAASPAKLYLFLFGFLWEPPVCFQAYHLVIGGVGVANSIGKREVIIKKRVYEPRRRS